MDAARPNSHSTADVALQTVIIQYRYCQQKASKCSTDALQELHCMPFQHKFKGTLAEGSQTMHPPGLRTPKPVSFLHLLACLVSLGCSFKAAINLLAAIKAAFQAYTCLPVSRLLAAVDGTHVHGHKDAACKLLNAT
eukprot:1161494-Pelagomonas_calceolata.AAC.7